MDDQFDSMEEWARWKVLEVSLQANEEINRMKETGQGEYPLLNPDLDSIEITIGRSDPLKHCSCSDETACEHLVGDEDCVIITCQSDKGVIMRLNYALNEAQAAG